ncbi:immunity repressor [Mycobacterium phage Philonius]|uniref:Immunity repressor n=4 Tax=Caudoviricetes TaxID=2731619 RepID=G1FTX3_9CAUD|nr:transcriptional repressor [Mycobacterium phage Charlie]YP_010051899.1 transcriptional repressor [Mycobacterium phage Philonius]YP_010051971.1 transcriptional repressor [Mycobacterium phage Aggie]AEL19987.1 immunity repressor [Mycobacterium phage Charlie]ATW60094.1 immunity repressor [Mycobacterium phage Philonius]AXQ51400.1 immunity repressor [Mycobacterium phage Aggie]
MSTTVIELNPSGADFHQEVASRLRIGLSATGAKSKDVAKAVGMAPSAFSKRVRGAQVLDVAEVDQIAAATGLSRDWLFTGQGPMFNPDGWCPQLGSNQRPADYQTVVRPFPVRRIADTHDSAA